MRHRERVDPGPQPHAEGDRVFVPVWGKDYEGIVKKVYLYKDLVWAVEAQFPDKQELVRMVGSAFKPVSKEPEVDKPEETEEQFAERLADAIRRASQTDAPVWDKISQGLRDHEIKIAKKVIEIMTEKTP